MRRDHETGTALLKTIIGVCVAMLGSASLLIVGLATRPAGGLSLPAGYKVVHVEEYDYGIRIDGPVPSGNVVFVDTNRGTIPHELVVFQTKGADAPMPVLRDKTLNEDSDQLDSVMDSGSSLNPGETRLLTADLDPGTYIAVCNLPAHFHFGMQRRFTIG